jgi:hypothetical protein
VKTPCTKLREFGEGIEPRRSHRTLDWLYWAAQPPRLPSHDRSAGATDAWHLNTLFLQPIPPSLTKDKVTLRGAVALSPFHDVLLGVLWC